MEGVACVSGGRKKDGGALGDGAMVVVEEKSGVSRCHVCFFDLCIPHHNDVTRCRNRQCSLSPSAMSL
jgi:hypothetical protein